MKEKFIGKYMRLARQIGTDCNPCHSRQIGVVIVDPLTNRILGTGYNGPPPGTPHPDSLEFLRDYFWPQLTTEDKLNICTKLGVPGDTETTLKQAFLDYYVGKKICPRRLVGAASGQRNELCSCGHAERHAITNAAQSVAGAYMFCWCGVPCLQCCDSIIQSGIKRVYCIAEETDYHKMSRQLLTWGGVGLIEVHPDLIETLGK